MENFIGVINLTGKVGSSSSTMSTNSFVERIQLKDEDLDSISYDEFEVLWSLKPVEKLKLNLGGRDVTCPRYSMTYMRDYKFNTLSVNYSDTLPQSLD